MKIGLEIQPISKIIPTISTFTPTAHWPLSCPMLRINAILSFRVILRHYQTWSNVRHYCIALRKRLSRFASVATHNLTAVAGAHRIRSFMRDHPAAIHIDIVVDAHVEDRCKYRNFEVIIKGSMTRCYLKCNWSSDALHSTTEPSSRQVVAMSRKS